MLRLPRIIFLLGLAIAALMLQGCLPAAKSTLPPVASGNTPTDPADEAPVTPSRVYEAGDVPMVEYRGNSN